MIMRLSYKTSKPCVYTTTVESYTENATGKWCKILLLKRDNCTLQCQNMPYIQYTDEHNTSSSKEQYVTTQQIIQSVINIHQCYKTFLKDMQTFHYNAIYVLSNICPLNKTIYQSHDLPATTSTGGLIITVPNTMIHKINRSSE